MLVGLIPSSDPHLAFILSLQIVDARNPMVMCTDLNQYVKEVDPKKKVLLLVNKADLLTARQRYLSGNHLISYPLFRFLLLCHIRVAWARYFHKEGIHFLFWSANFEKMKLEARDNAGAPEHQPEEEAAQQSDEEGKEEEEEEKEEEKHTEEKTDLTEDREEKEAEEGEKIESSQEKPEKEEIQSEQDELYEKLSTIYGVNDFLEYLLDYCPPPTDGTVAFPVFDKCLLNLFNVFTILCL